MGRVIETREEKAKVDFLQQLAKNVNKFVSKEEIELVPQACIFYKLDEEPVPISSSRTNHLKLSNPQKINELYLNMYIKQVKVVYNSFFCKISAQCFPDMVLNLNVHYLIKLRFPSLTFKDRIPSKDLLNKFDLLPVRRVVQHNQLRWFGHVVRMDNHNWVKRCMTLDVEEEI